jgi:hypothetical protein
VRVEADGELADVARAGVGIEDFIGALRVVARGLDDLALLEGQLDVVERGAEVNRRRVW